MKQTFKHFSLKISFLIAVISFGTSFNFAQTSSKGNWSETDISLAIIELEKVRGEIDAYIGEELTDVVIACILEKIEQKYENFAQADSNQDGIEEITVDCVVTAKSTETVVTPAPSKKGWSESDKAEILESFDNQRASLAKTLGEENVDDFIDCVIWKVVHQIGSLEEAYADLDQVRKISSECSLFIMDEEPSSKGNWNGLDKIKTRIYLSETEPTWIELVGNKQTDLLTSNIIAELEEKYENFETAKTDISTFSAVKKQQLKKLLDSGISYKGNWSESDYEMMREELSILKESLEPTVGKEKSEEIAACILDSLEQHYANIDVAAEDDEGLTLLGEECMKQSLPEGQ